MAGIAEGRLREERRSWRKDHPIGFVARPRSKADGSTDLLNWDVVIPGKKDTMSCAVSVLRLGVTRRWRERQIWLPHPVDAIAAICDAQVGGLRVQPHDGVLERLPRHRTNRQVRVAAGRGRELCGNQRHQADAATEKISRRWRGAPEI